MSAKESRRGGIGQKIVLIDADKLNYLRVRLVHLASKARRSHEFRSRRVSLEISTLDSSELGALGPE